MGRFTSTAATAVIAFAGYTAATSAGHAAIFTVSCQNTLVVTSVRASPLTGSTLSGAYSYAITVQSLSDNFTFFRVSFVPGPLMSAGPSIGPDHTVDKKGLVHIDIGTGLQPNVDLGSVRVVYGETASAPMTLGIHNCRQAVRQDRPPN